MAIEYTFATTAHLKSEILLELLSHSIGDADNYETLPTGYFVLGYENLMSVWCLPPTFTPDSPSQMHWKETLGSRPEIIIRIRFINGADAKKIAVLMLKFIQEFLNLFDADAVFTYHDILMLRHKGHLLINTNSEYWAERLQTLKQPYTLTSDPRPDNAVTPD